MSEAKNEKVRAALGRVGGFIGRHKKLFIFLAVLAVAAVVVFMVLGNMSSSAASTVQAPQTLTLAKTDLELIVAGDGTVQSATSRQVATTLSSEITAIYVQEGDYVNAGDKLCQLDTTDVEKDIANAKKDIAKAQSSDKINLDAAQRKLNTAIEQYSIDETTQNRKVQEAADAINNARATAGATAGNAAMEAAANADAAGKTINEKAAVDAAQQTLAAAQTTLANAQSALALAQAEYEAALASGDPVAIADKETARSQKQTEANDAQAAADAAQTAATAAQNAYDTAYKAAYDSFKANNQYIYNDAYNNAYNSANVSSLQSAYDAAVDNRDSVLRNDNTSIASAREALASQKLADSAASYKTQLESYEKQLADSTITAPVAGTIVEMTAEVGLTPSAAAGNAASATGAGASSSLFTIKDEGALEITVAIPEYDAVEVADGMSVTITSDAVSGEEWQGVVSDISPATDANSNFTVTIRVTSAADKLAIGMSAKVNILVDGKAGVFAVPYDAVTTDASGQSMVYVLEEGAAQSQGTPAGPTGEGGAPATPQGRAIPVETGMETDYYIEISGEGLAEGMTLLADPEGKNVSTGGGGMMFGMGGGF